MPTLDTSGCNLLEAVCNASSAAPISAESGNSLRARASTSAQLPYSVGRANNASRNAASSGCARLHKAALSLLCSAANSSFSSSLPSPAWFASVRNTPTCPRSRCTSLMPSKPSACSISCWISRSLSNPPCPYNSAPICSNSRVRVNPAGWVCSTLPT